jgi:hypothetical protein
LEKLGNNYYRGINGFIGSGKEARKTNMILQPGTYCFLNTINNKVYVGSAQCLNTRINHHLKGLHSNPLLQNALKKYGLKAFNITYVITETHAEARMQEQLLLDYIFQNNVPKYNLSPVAGGGKTLINYSNHNSQSRKIYYALEVNNSNNIYTFESGYEANKFTNVLRSSISDSCKKGKPYNSESGRWLFSDVSINNLKAQLNNLTQKEIKGLNNYSKGFILINKITRKQSQIFYSSSDPIKYGYILHQSSLIQCLLGKLKSVNGYYITLCI